MDATLLTELEGIAPRIVSLFKLELPGGDVLWCDAGFVVWGADTYSAEHADYGVISSVSPIRDGADGQATRIELEVLPTTDAGVAGLASALAQGSPLTWWEGAVSPATGLLVGTPALKFLGEYDRPRLSVGQSRGLVLECGTEAERQLEPNEEWRLNDAHQQSVWPGDLGCIHVTDNPQKVWWRANEPRTSSFGRNPTGNLGGGWGDSTFTPQPSTPPAPFLGNSR